MNLIERATLADDVTFQQKIRICAFQIAAETATKESPQSEDQRALPRRALAAAVYQAKSDTICAIAYAVASHELITSSTPDDDTIKRAVKAVWDAMSGAPPVTSEPNFA